MLKLAWPLGTLAAALMTVGGYVALNGEHKATLAAALMTVRGYVAFNGENKAPTRYKTAAVSLGTVETFVTATGMINPLLSVLVGTQVTGRIQSLHADFNSMVKAGDVIARIDPAVYQARRDQANANWIMAQASVSNALATVTQRKREFDRVARLLEQQFVSQNDVDVAHTLHQGAVAQWEVAQAQVKQAEAQLQAADLDLNYTVIRTPVDGIVIARNVEVGQTVTASFQTPNLFLIAHDLARMQIDTSVSEADIGGITVGMHAHLTVDAYPGEIFRGIVQQVRLAPVNIQNVITYNVVIRVDNRGVRLKPGMTAHVTMEIARKDGVLRVPSAALRFTPPVKTRSASASKKNVTSSGQASEQASEQAGDSKAVWKLGSEGFPEMVPLQLGLADSQYVEIQKGDLKDGDEVIIGVDSPRDKKVDALPPGFNPGQRRGSSRD